MKIKQSLFLQLILVVFSWTAVSGQVKSIGIPLIQNYKKSEYNADTQNWDLIEDENGMIYAGNNGGVLQFDGVEWNLFPVNNNSIVRSLALGNNGQIFVGAYGELGQLVGLPNGDMRYESLLDKIPDQYRNFDDVWKTYQTRYGIIFQSFDYVFIYNDGYMKTITPESRFGFSFYTNNNFYVVDKSKGLQILDDGALKTVSNDPIFANNEIRFILPYLANTFLIGTLSNGCFILENDRIKKWEGEANKLWLENKIFSGIKIEDIYAIGSIKNGLFFINEQGQVVQHLNRQKGLQNNTVLSMFRDRSNNLWLGLDNGIDYIKISLPISLLNYNYNIETTYASVVYEDVLYVGTNQGLFAKPLNLLSNIDDIDFEMVQNTEGQVWCLTVIDNTLFCGHNSGAFIIEGMKANTIYSDFGVWNFIQPSVNKQIILSGTYDGVIQFSKEETGWTYNTNIEGIDISVRDLTEDLSGNFWLNHVHKGTYKLTFNPSFTKTLQLSLYNADNRLPEELPYFIHQIGGQLFFSTRDGIYQYNFIQDNFLRPMNLNEFYEDLGLIYKLFEDNEGNIWYFSDTDIGVYKLLEDGNFVNISAPFKHLRNSIMESYSNISVYDEENIFIGTKDGLVHYNPEITKDYFYEISPVIKQVYISDATNDSLWFEKGSVQNNMDISEDRFELPFHYNTLLFRFSSNDIENAKTSEFRIRFVGFSDTWSEWTSNTAKEYTKLREGTYRFEVQTRNIYGNVSNIEAFTFRIKPPFYRTILAYIIYVIFFITLIGISVYYLIARIEKVRKSEKEKQELKFQEKTQKLQNENIIAEQELVRLRNEKLRINVKHKNKELANATYHILQKNKFLNKLKNDLSQLSKKAKSEWVEQELKRISRNIDRDIYHEQNWKVFNKYFDEVHQEFLEKLKEEYPELTPKDMRLCAYLRMNISTKEIAPLLNISVRGVEISRYRLRKKLNLDRDVNLIEFLLSL